MCVKEELESVDCFTIGETPTVEVPEVPWTPPNNNYMRCMNAWKSRPSFFSVVGKTARTVNLLEFFDWMDEQKLKTQKQAAPSDVSPPAPIGVRPAAPIGVIPTAQGCDHLLRQNNFISV